MNTQGAIKKIERLERENAGLLETINALKRR